MNVQERTLIADLFDRVRAAGSAYRDPEAEAFINEQIARQPHAPYAMAQTLIVQNQSLEAAKARIEELERRLDDARSAAAPERRDTGGATPWGPRASEAMGAPAGSSGGGLFGRSGYGGGQPYGAPPPQQPIPQAGRSGGGFLSGALQTAAGVAGGALLFSGLSSLFGGDKAEAAGSEAAKAVDAPGEAASGEGGWFSGLLDDVGGPSSERADEGGPDDDGGGDGDGWL